MMIQRTGNPAAAHARQYKAKPWSVPRLRGRGKQGNIVMHTVYPSALCVATFRLFVYQERSRSIRRSRPHPCSPRPRKRGALHGWRTPGLIRPLL